MVRFFLAISMFVFFIDASPALAQSLGNQPDPIQFLVTPEVPQPGDDILIEAQGVGNFLGESTITWQLNGKTVKSGLGERSFSFTAGGLGVQTTVRATIDSPTKGVITKSFTFLPSLVQILWEADTSVPPWYKGKALYSAGSNLTLMAIPQVILNGKTVTSNNLSFYWKRNNTPLTSQSGRGMSVISIEGNQLLSAESLSVDVMVNNALVGRGQVTIPATAPQVVLYERDPLRGVLYDRALIQSTSLTKNEITLEAQPFYFSKTSLKAGTYEYTWSLNNQTITGPDSAKGILTLRQSGSGKGRAAIETELQNTDPSMFVQSAQTALQILFGGATSNAFTSFFGI